MHVRIGALADASLGFAAGIARVADVAALMGKHAIDDRVELAHARIAQVVEVAAARLKRATAGL